MVDTTLLLGGARSGKSLRALTLAETIGSRRLFIATAEALDAEMSERIAHHRRERGAGWVTREVPLDLADAISADASDLPSGGCATCADSPDVVVVDCLTLWLSNLMHHGRDVATESARLREAIVAARRPLLLVSNEVGFALVPETPLGRRFRDEQGRLNRRVAEVCTHVELVVAGLPLVLKGGSSPGGGPSS